MPRESAYRDMRTIQQSFHSFTQIVASNPALWIGFACVCAWPWTCTSATLAYANAVTVGSPVWIGSNFTYLIIGIAGIAFGIGSRRVGERFPNSAVAVIAGVCYVAASALFVQLSKLPIDYLDPSYATVSFIWPVFAGIGQTLLFLEWMKAFGGVGPRKTIAFVVSASVFGSALLFAMNFFPQFVREFMPAIVGVTAAACAYRMAQRIPAEDAPGTTAPSPVGLAIPKAPRAPWKLLLTTLVAGFSFGVFQSLSFTGAFGTTAWYANGVVGFLVASVLFALITLVLRMNFNYMIYRVSFVIMAAGAFVCLFGSEASSWGYGIYCVGYRCFDMLVWCLCAYLIRHRSVSPIWLGGLSIGTLLAGRFLGFELFTLLHPLVGREDVSLLVASVLLVLLVTALFLVSHNNLLEAWGMVKPGETLNDREIAESCCMQIAGQYRLSAREREVLLQMAQGKSRAEIGDELVLSEETIKTHLRHIYQKCGIHSRKELEDMVARRIREVKEDRIDLMKSDAEE
ncbi:response regulator transcription factor [Raoultibacter massiliensis]|uniref:helix-turn-helix transcriptional regulator n=1 Tax=Raoultibacter massiliensis TaxID=1852371 RepID=UPI003A93FF6C